MDDCLFCRIVAGEIPATVVHETDVTMAFRDIAPKAPTHVLVIPKAHHTDIEALVNADPALAERLLVEAAQVADAEGIGDAWRLVFNTGAGAGQTVFHTHLHLLAGRPMTWPPG